MNKTRSLYNLHFSKGRGREIRSFPIVLGHEGNKAVMPLSEVRLLQAG